MQNLFHVLEELLRQREEFFSQVGTLLRNLVIEKGLKLDPDLLDLLLSHDRIKQHFFTKVGDVLVFDKEKFLQFVNNKEFLPDSYTIFKNKIGLSDDGGKTLISQKQDVSLVWPYKDCVLEGGQTKEDSNRDEIFWNTTLAPDDISNLLEPKVFTNWGRFKSEGEVMVGRLAKRDNLIIRGNNLLTVKSLEKRYGGNVKLIYIDPPFNTGADSFNYNDQFKQSTWLTFMRNRLSMAKNLLSEDGLLFVHISYHNQAYLKVLLDEIYKLGYICTFNLLVRHPDRILKADKVFHDVVEYLLVYAKNPKTKIGKPEVESGLDRYIYSIEELTEGNQLDDEGLEDVIYFLPDEYVINKTEPQKSNLKRISIRGSLKDGNSSGRFYEKYLAPKKSEFPPHTLFKVPNIGNDGLGYRYFYTPKEGRQNGGYYQGVPEDYTGTREKPYANFMDFVNAYNNVGYEGGVDFRNAKKPESLIMKIFEIADVDEDDLVMDFFLGSGTTAAVAHKMGIQYIGIEQIDYGKNNPSFRLKNVIDGDQTGISKDVNWQGGGDFVYCELLQWNDYFVRKIEAADDKTLSKIWQEIQAEAHLSYKVNPKSINEHAEEFDDLSMGDQKQILLEVFDKNVLYVNFSEIDDVEYDVSEEDKRLNRQFYGVEI